MLYYDTDSVIYSWKEDQPFNPTGIFLGEMTDELGEDPIMEFGSAGPKSYCYQTVSGQSECKNKGTKSSNEITSKSRIILCEIAHIKQSSYRI